MGYDTDIIGSFKITPSLKEENIEYLKKFSDTRRMKRDLPDFGIDGEYDVDGSGDRGQDFEDNIIDYNSPPKTQPSLWCHWVVNDNGDTLKFNGDEKFYGYIDWLIYLINNFFGEKYMLNGEVKWQGESKIDTGSIIIENNIITIISDRGAIIFPNYKKNDFMFT